MKIKGVPRLNANEYPEARPWIDRMLNPLNEALGSMFLALTRNLTFADNVYSVTREIEFVNDVEIPKIKHGLKTYLGVIIIGSPEETSLDYLITGWKARRTDVDTIAMTVRFAGGGTTTGKVKFIVLGG